MAKFKIGAGAELELLTKEELSDALSEADAWEVARLQAEKWMRLPQLLSGNASSGSLVLGETAGDIVGPREGYFWSIRRLVVSGLTSGASPDVVNLYLGTAAGQPLWQFNGNNFGYTFGKGQLSLRAGENLALASVGTFAATGTITLSGELVEVPAQLAGKVI
jgi:hypothetical protein